MHVIALAGLLGGVIAPFALQRWWGLLAAPVGLLGAWAVGLMCPLRVVTNAEHSTAVQRAKWTSRVAIGLFALVLLSAALRLWRDG